MKNLTTVILLYLTLLALCLGSEIFVGVDGVDSPECGATFNTSCASITYALGLAVPNDIIILLPGTYNFSSVVISKQNITIRSTEGPATTIQCPALEQYCIDVQASGCLIEGLTFVGMDTASTIIHAAGLAPPATVVMRCTFTGISSTTGTSALIEVENMAPPVQQQALDDPSQTYGIVIDGCVIENIQQKILIEADSANVVLRGSYIRDISLTNELDSRAINFLYATNAALAAAFLIDDCSFLNITASVVISAEPGPTQVNTISNSYFYGIVASIAVYFSGQTSGSFVVSGNTFDNNTAASLIAAGSMVGAGQVLTACSNSFNYNMPQAGSKYNAAINVLQTATNPYPKYDTVVCDSSFTHNSVPSVAINRFQSVLINNNTFEENNAYSVILDSVNAEALAAPRVATVSANEFSDNLELSVVVYGNTQNTSNAHVVDVYLQQNSFEDNTGNKAGAVFSRAADTTIYLTDNEFERNSAGDVNGGAIVCSNLAPINASILVFQGAKSTFSGNEPRNIGTGELACSQSCDSTNDSICNPKSGSSLTWLWVTLSIGGALVVLIAIAGIVYFVRHRYLHNGYDTV